MTLANGNAMQTVNDARKIKNEAKMEAGADRILTKGLSPLLFFLEES